MELLKKYLYLIKSVLYGIKWKLKIQFMSNERAVDYM